MVEKCLSCRFWFGKVDTSDIFNIIYKDGPCKRYPYQVYKNSDDWCGEFNLKNPKPEDMFKMKSTEPKIIPKKDLNYD